MKVLITLTLDIEEPGRVVDALNAIDPPRVPGFKGIARVVMDPEASVIEEWLDQGGVKDVEVTPN